LRLPPEVQQSLEGRVLSGGDIWELENNRGTLENDLENSENNIENNENKAANNLVNSENTPVNSENTHVNSENTPHQGGYSYCKQLRSGWPLI
jgi:hypothetical protein